MTATPRPTEPPQPRTEVGRALLAFLEGQPTPADIAWRDIRGDICAIERAAALASSPAPAGLRAALRAVLRDFDREPGEEYLDEAERIFLASSPAPAGLEVGETCSICGALNPDEHGAGCSRAAEEGEK
jgi:hypothetical protein